MLSYLLISAHQPFHISSVLSEFSSINFTFLSTAITLTVIRRLFVSPLSKFQGTKIAAISRLWEANEFRTGRASITRKKLFAQYGSGIIRVGPNEVCVNNVEANAMIYKGKYNRGTFYKMGTINGEFNLNTTRGLQEPWYPCQELTDNHRMADLMFSHNAGMPDGTGGGSYMGFIHKYMSVIAVRTP